MNNNVRGGLGRGPGGGGGGCEEKEGNELIFFSLLNPLKAKAVFQIVHSQVGRLYDTTIWNILRDNDPCGCTCMFIT